MYKDVDVENRISAILLRKLVPVLQFIDVIYWVVRSSKVCNTFCKFSNEHAKMWDIRPEDGLSRINYLEISPNMKPWMWEIIVFLFAPTTRFINIGRSMINLKNNLITDFRRISLNVIAY